MIFQIRFKCIFIFFYIASINFFSILRKNKYFSFQKKKKKKKLKLIIFNK
jgi:hypothetical protein